MQIDIYQDIVCPWCRIGERNLLEALKLSNRSFVEGITVNYRAYPLDPDLPPEGCGLLEAMTVKMGGAANVPRVIEHVTKVGAEAGIVFRFDLITTLPNTNSAHRFISLARPDKKAEIVDALYRAYFEEGRDIGKLDELSRIAQRAGLDELLLRKRLEQGDGAESVKDDLDSARSVGVDGVPFFVFNDKYTLSGAYPAAELTCLLERLKYW
ncbi:DsbA family protein [Paenibacillus tarimensis]